jgi:hypothetical protein
MTPKQLMICEVLTAVLLNIQVFLEATLRWLQGLSGIAQKLAAFQEMTLLHEVG